MTVEAAPPAQDSRVLLVEDNSADALLVARAFRNAGLAPPMRISNGEDAVAYLAGTGQYTDRVRHPLPRLVLLDLKLPRRSGIEVLQWTRAQPSLQPLPMVILTASREEFDLRAAYLHGANSYLVKPVGSAALQQMIAALGLYWLTHNIIPPLEDTP